jgi:hypothetical protein
LVDRCVVPKGLGYPSSFVVAHSHDSFSNLLQCLRVTQVNNRVNTIHDINNIAAQKEDCLGAIRTSAPQFPFQFKKIALR